MVNGTSTSAELCVARHNTTQSGVWFLSTCHDGRESGGAVRRRRRGSASLMKTAPLVAIDYNKYMGGCDRANSLRASYNTYLTHSTTQLTHKVFRLRVVQLFAARSLNRQHSVTEDECGPRKRCNPDTLGPERQLPGPHLITKFMEGQRMCVWCYHSTKKRSQTSYFCSLCKFALHADCFLPFHQARLV